jgi:hypothetical protein
MYVSEEIKGKAWPLNPKWWSKLNLWHTKMITSANRRSNWQDFRGLECWGDMES